MFDTNIDLIAILKASLVKIPHVLQSYLWALLVFAVLAALIFFISERRNGKVSARNVLGHVFPGALYRHPSSRVDLLASLLQTGVWQPFIAAVSALVVGVNVRDLLIEGLGDREPLLHATWAIVSIQCAAAFLIIDFSGYVAHYCMHKVPWLWSFHRPHHSAEVLTFLTVNRSHPLESLIGGVFIAGGIGGLLTGVVLYFLGTPMSPVTTAAIAGFYGTVIPVIGVLHHCHVPMSLGRLNYIFSTPVMHQLHHSVEIRHRDKNFATSLMIYDWIFGTIYVPKERESYRWGVNDAELGENNPHNRFRDFYLEPLRHSWMALKQEARRFKNRSSNNPCINHADSR